MVNQAQSQPLQCRCGVLRGQVVPSRTAIRARCYCRDCRAFARFLGADGLIDAAGGTEIVATLPRQVRFTAGADALACLSLSPRGIYRWYAGCCNTPIGNTPRNPKIAYVGLVALGLSGTGPSMTDSFGPLRMAVNTASASKPVRATPLATALGMAGLAGAMVAARLSGAYRDNPFFQPGTATPVRPVRVLSRDERQRADAQAPG
jgi:hypothetical protein